MRRLAFLALCGSAAACDLPIRDNPTDPENRPVVVLRAFTVVNGVRVENSFTRRNTPFIFDATESKDPDGRTLSYRWDFDGDLDFDDLDTPGLVLQSNGGIAIVAPSISLADLPPDTTGEGIVTREVHVQVRAGDSRVRDSILVGISNERPFVDPGEEIAIPSGIGQTVTLDACGGSSPCLTVDPDGDVLSGAAYEWEQVAGASAEPTALGTAGLATFTAPLTPGVLAYRLTATDGLASASARQIVRVGPQVWARTAERFYRLNVEQRANNVVSIATSGLDVIAVEPVTGEIWVAGYRTTGGTDVRRFAPDGITLLDSWLLPHNGAKSIAPSGASAIVAHDDGFTRCSPVSVETEVVVDTTDGEAVATRDGVTWLLTRTKLYRDSGAGPVFLDSVPGGGQFFEAEMTLDENGVPWVVSSNGIYQLDNDELELRDSDNYDALAPHPDSGVWAVVHDNGTNTNSLVHVTENDARTITVIADLTGEVKIAAENRTRTLWVVDGIDLLRFDYPGDELIGPDAFDWPIEMNTATDEIVQYRAIAPDPIHGTVTVGAHTLDLVTGLDNSGRLAQILPSMQSTLVVPGTSPDSSLFANVEGAIAIDVIGRGAWLHEGLADGLWLVTPGGRRVRRAFADERGKIIGPYPNLSGGLYALRWDELDETLAVTTADANGDEILSVDLPYVRMQPVTEGNELGICAVTSSPDFLSGWPVRVDPTTGQLTEYSSTVTWDGFHIPHAAVSKDGGTCWFAERELQNTIVTASGTTAFRTNVASETLAMAGDPRPAGGMWRADAAGTISRFVGGAASFSAAGTPVTALAVERVCDAPLNADCANIWYAYPGVVVRAKTNGAIIQTFRVPGNVTDLSIR